MTYEKSCGGIVYRKFHGNTEILLIKHLKSGYWSFPKGHVENDETEEETAKREGADALYRRLAELDPDAAREIHPNNVRRVLRALEIYRTTGKPKSLWDEESRQTPPAMRLLVLGLFPTDREVLRARIDRRVDAMVAAGLREEVYALYRDGLLQKGSTAAEAIGYKEYLAAFSGACSEEEAVAEIKYATHRYARRQLTWFRAIPGILPLPCGEEGITEEGWERALRLTNEFLCCE